MKNIILIIDDQKNNLTSLKAVLEDCFSKIKIFTALSGEEGLKIANKERLDAILLDVIMPKMDGYEVCERLKKEDSTKHIPIAMISAIKADVESRVKGLNCGADAFLSKPIDASELTAQVKILFRIKEAEDKLRTELAGMSKSSQRDLQKSYSFQKKMVANIGDVIMIIDKDGINRYKSPNIEKYFGWKPSELIGKSTWDLVHQDDLKFAMKFLSNLKNPDDTGTTQLRYRCKDGSYRWIEITISNLLHDPEINGFLGNYHDITQQKEAEHNLVKALEKATESDRVKSAFLANMSHELRTPLTAIIGFSDLIKEESEIEEIQQFNKIVKSSGNHLLTIVDDLFDISLIEAGEVNLFLGDVLVNSLLRNIHSRILNEKHHLNKDDIEVIYSNQSDKDELLIYTDAAKLTQVLINLLKNALKFTTDGSINFGYKQIEEKGQKMLEFFVSDTGIGIEQKKFDIIFENFKQVNDSYTKTFGGVGIGLSISKKLTEFLGGRIWLESEVGVGSTFYFTIPVNGIEEDEKKLPVPETNIDAIKDKTILIVEDYEYSVQLLKLILRKEQIKTYWANNGESPEYQTRFKQFYEARAKEDPEAVPIGYAYFQTLAAAYPRGKQAFFTAVRQHDATEHESPRHQQYDFESATKLQLGQQWWATSHVADWVRGHVASDGPKLIEAVVQRVENGLGELLRIPLQVVTALLLAFFMLIEWDGVKSGMTSLRETRLRPIYDEFAPGVIALGKLIGKSFQGQVIIAFLNACLTLLALWLIGVDYKFILALVVFVFSFIPVLGVILSGIPICLIAILQPGGSIWMVLQVIIAVAVIHLIEGMVLSPRIIGKIGHLHPVLVIVILLIAEKFFGMWGLVLGVPVAIYIIRVVLLKSPIPGIYEPNGLVTAAHE